MILGCFNTENPVHLRKHQIPDRVDTIPVLLDNRGSLFDPFRWFPVVWGWSVSVLS